TWHDGPTLPHCLLEMPDAAAGPGPLPLARPRRTAAQHPRSLPVKINRREFALGTGGLALTGAGVLAGLSIADSQRPAFAQNPSLEELMQPGPLGDMALGDANAPVTIIEYASMTCPHCAHFHETTYPELKKKYIDTGKVRFIFREFPLDSLALAGSMLARCAGKDKYFPMIEA